MKDSYIDSNYSDNGRKKYKEKNKLLLSKIEILEETINNDSKYTKLREDLKMTLDEIDIRDNEIKELKKDLYEKDMKLKRNNFSKVLHKNEELCNKNKELINKNKELFNKNKELENIIKNKDNLLEQFSIEDSNKLEEIEDLSKNLKNYIEKMELSNNLYTKLKLNNGKTIIENDEMKNKNKMLECKVNKISENNIALTNNFNIITNALSEDIDVLDIEKRHLCDTNKVLVNNFQILSQSIYNDIDIFDCENEKLNEENLAILSNYKMISDSITEDNITNNNILKKNKLITELREFNKCLTKENKSSKKWEEYYKQDYVKDKKIIKNLNLDISNLTNDNIKLNSMKLNYINEINTMKKIIGKKKNKIIDYQKIIDNYDSILTEIGTDSYKRELEIKEELNLYKNECESLENEIEKIRILLSNEKKIRKKYMNMLDDFGYYEITDSDINDAIQNT